MKRNEVIKKAQGAGGVQVKDRTYRFKTYKACFIAKEFVTWLQATYPERFASRDQAIAFAQELLSEGDIQHSAGKTKFVDGHYFYVFQSGEDVVKGQMEMPAIMKYFQENPSDFDALAVRLKDKCIVKNRTFHQKTYKQCFLGSEAVDILVADISENHQTISREDAVFVGQQLMNLDLFIHVTKDHPFKDEGLFYKFTELQQFFLNCQKVVFNLKRVGQLRKAQGRKPQFPVIIVPGLASSALEVWETPKSSWQGERIWLDIAKVGKAAKLAKLEKAVAKFRKGKSNTEEESEEKISRVWLRHMVLGADGFSDPEGIRVRPVQGLHACDYLSTNPLTKKPTYVMAYVIKNLMDAGWDLSNLAAASYDWRLPPTKLETRDGYFTQLKAKIESFRVHNDQKVVLMGHSMGNRTIQYFLCWAKQSFGQGWLDENVQGMVALGAPFLGATKVVRGLISGDQIGLDMFLTLDEAITFSQGLGSMPWLLPLEEKLLPSPTVLLRDDDSKDPSWKQQDAFSIIKELRPGSWKMWEEFYLEDKCFLKKREGEELPPVLEIPPVANLWCIYGINLKTEISYFYNKHNSHYHLDSSGASPLNEVFTVDDTNKHGLPISGGVAFETKTTPQEAFGRVGSGDGTVPFCSLAYCHIWKSRAEEKKTGQNIIIHELHQKEHRTMLKDDVVIDKILECLLTPVPENFEACKRT